MHWSALITMDWNEVREIVSDHYCPFTRKDLENAVVEEFRGEARPKMLQVLRAAERQKHYDEFMRSGTTIERTETEFVPVLKGKVVQPVMCRNGELMLDY